jgi:hypothetical protein
MRTYLKKYILHNNINVFSRIFIHIQSSISMTLLKKINIYIPKTENLPQGFSDLSPEDTSIVLNCGYRAFQSVKEDMRLLSGDELYKSIRSEIEQVFEEERRTFKDRLEKAEKDLVIQQELYKHTITQNEENGEKLVAKRVETYERLQAAYKEEREHMQNRIIALETQVATANARTREEAMKLVNQELENLKHILAEKDKHTAHLKSSLDKAVEKIDSMTQKKTTVSLGKIGEKQFDEVARGAFRDFDGFEIEDMHSVAGQGDFHLKFKGFTVLADSKLYSNKVNSTSRDKIKRDLKKNEHIQFAWLVSLDTTIDKFDKAPFMFEWLTERKCVCYINELLKYDEPGEILRAVWHCCNTLHSIMLSEEGAGGDTELTRLREHELKIKEIVQKMVKNNRERETIMGQLRSNFDKNDEYIREILNEETNKIAGDYYGIVVNWWNNNMIEQEGAAAITTTILWPQFKKDNEQVIGIMDCNLFKDILMSFVSEKNLVKPKTKTGALKIMNYLLKTN